MGRSAPGRADSFGDLGHLAGCDPRNRDGLPAMYRPETPPAGPIGARRGLGSTRTGTRAAHAGRVRPGRPVRSGPYTRSVRSVPYIRLSAHRTGCPSGNDQVEGVGRASWAGSSTRSSPWTASAVSANGRRCSAASITGSPRIRSPRHRPGTPGTLCLPRLITASTVRRWPRRSPAGSRHVLGDLPTRVVVLEPLVAADPPDVITDAVVVDVLGAHRPTGDLFRQCERLEVGAVRPAPAAHVVDLTDPGARQNASRREPHRRCGSRHGPLALVPLHLAEPVLHGAP